VTDTHCRGLQSCVLVANQSLASPSQPERQDLTAPSCKFTSGGLGLGDTCTGDPFCASGACITGAGLFGLNVCSQTCGTSADCDRLEQQEADITSEEAVRRFEGVLDAAGPDGVAPKQLVAIAGRKKSWVYDELDKRMKDGTCVQVSRGRYRRPPGWQPVSSGDAA
jgi:hypothetical protein